MKLINVTGEELSKEQVYSLIEKFGEPSDIINPLPSRLLGGVLEKTEYANHVVEIISKETETIIIVVGNDVIFNMILLKACMQRCKRTLGYVCETLKREVIANSVVEYVRDWEYFWSFGI